MIIWPEQLKAIQRLAATEGLSTVELLPLAKRIRVTVSTNDGPWSAYEVYHNGDIKELEIKV